MKTKITIGTLLLLILLSAPFVAYFLSPIDSSASSKIFSIKKGAGIREIASFLESEELIKSPAMFMLYSVLSGSADKLKAGNYELSRSMSLPSIIRVLRNGPKEDMTILVREGETLAEIEKDLVDAQVIKKNALSKFPGKSLEGFLFPDTYRFFPNSDIKDVVKKFLENFSDKAMPVLVNNEVRIRNYELGAYEKLIVASIIEKEVPFEEDRYLVAGVLYKRLEIGMPLQVDAWPWTYEHYGLPSRPIANPGKSAIKAAAKPKASDYLYYLSDPKTKKTIFSKTFEEHKDNKLKYLKR